jgi:uncharacterized membrane protein YdjX (TVP38/TMEM64 family)
MDLFSLGSHINLPFIIQYIRTFGLMAPLAAFLLFALQAAFPVFPYLILAAAAGMIFGFKLGILLSWSGALAGACLAYGLCRLLGANRTNHFIQRHLGYDVKQFDREMAFWSILAARIIPIIPTPAINIAAAVGEVPFWNFFFSSALGKLPTAILYTGLGVCLFNARDIKTVLLILSALLLLAITFRYWSKHRVKS